jgi:hypothetical protein
MREHQLHSPSTALEQIAEAPSLIQDHLPEQRAWNVSR